MGKRSSRIFVKGICTLPANEQGDTLNLTLPMPVRRVYGNPLVRHVAGKVAIQRGPLVYCLEQADNGESLHNLWLPTDAPFTTFEGKGLFSHKILDPGTGLPV
ncbi:hypothetical protein ACLBOM_03585 [Escherichia coli]